MDNKETTTSIEPVFNLKHFIFWVVGLHLLVYLCWAFVIGSLTTPLTAPFENPENRKLYLTFLLLGALFGGPIYCPFKEVFKTK